MIEITFIARLVAFALAWFWTMRGPWRLAEWERWRFTGVLMLSLFAYGW